MPPNTVLFAIDNNGVPCRIVSAPNPEVRPEMDTALAVDVQGFVQQSRVYFERWRAQSSQPMGASNQSTVRHQSSLSHSQAVGNLQQDEHLTSTLGTLNNRYIQGLNGPTEQFQMPAAPSYGHVNYYSRGLEGSQLKHSQMANHPTEAAGQSTHQLPTMPYHAPVEYSFDNLVPIGPTDFDEPELAIPGAGFTEAQQENRLMPDESEEDKSREDKSEEDIRQE